MSEPSPQARPPWPRLTVTGLLAASIAALLALALHWLLGRLLPPGLGLIRVSLAIAITFFFLALGFVALRLRLKRASVATRIAISSGLAVGGLGVLFAISPNLSGALLGSPGALLMPMSWVFAAWGIQLIVLGIKGRRRGDTLHCPKCDYELGVPEPEAPIRCPECGHPWLGGWVKGQRVRSPRLAWTGAALLAVPLFALATSYTSLGGTVVHMLPTGTVITLASMDAWGKNAAAWSEVTSRTLSPAQEASLAERLLDARRRSDYLYGPPSVWLETAVLKGGAAGPLPQVLRDRYFAEFFEPRIDVPDRLGLSAAAPLRIAGTDRSGGAPSWMYVWIDEVRVDDVSIDVTPWRPKNSGGWIFALYLRVDDLPFRISVPGSGPGEPPPLDTSTPGSRRIVVRLQEALVPRSTTPGKGGPPLWTGTREIEKTVVVGKP